MLSKTEISKLTFSSGGKPWCKITAPNINANNLTFALYGKIWWGHSDDSTQIGNVKRILKVDWPYVKTIINVEG